MQLRDDVSSVSFKRLLSSGLREVWSIPQYPSRSSVEESSESVVAHAEQEPEGVPFSEYAAHCPVECELPRHQIGSWMVDEGWGNVKGKFGV